MDWSKSMKDSIRITDLNYSALKGVTRINKEFLKEQGKLFEEVMKTGNSNKKDTYEKEKKPTIGGYNFEDVLFVYNKNMGDNDKTERVGDKVIKEIEDKWKACKSDYGYLANGGNSIVHNGVTFGYNGENDVISLGDMSDEENVISIGLSGGTTLRVNRNNIDDLVKSLDMFKPEDIRRIMEAISTDTRARNKPTEIEKEVTDTYEEILDNIQGNEEKKIEKEKK